MLQCNVIVSVVILYIFEATIVNSNIYLFNEYPTGVINVIFCIRKFTNNLVYTLSGQKYLYTPNIHVLIV